MRMPQAVWTFVRGWPCKWDISEFDAAKSELSIETLEIAHDGLTYAPLPGSRMSGANGETNEPRARPAALANPTFATRAGRLAMHAANRHVERWAPEAGASRVRPLRSLGFVDRLVAPWLEVAQRSASMRLFQQYRNEGMAERPGSNVSWVFPRPWYQDELDWMAASRQVGEQTAMAQTQAPSMLTTRGTYVAPAQARASSIALPAALYEYIAPSITPPARNDLAMPAGLA